MRQRPKHRSARRIAGMSMVELLVAMTIGTFLMWGAITVYSRSRTTYQVSEQVSRLQENARYAVSVIEPDIRLANYWGLTNDSTVVTGTARPVDVASPLQGTTNICGNNFAVNLGEIIRGDNNGYALPCAAYTSADVTGGVAQTGTDSLTVRRVTVAPTALANNMLQMYTTRSGQFTQVFKNGVAPAALGPNAEIHDVIVDTFYIDRDSVGRPNIPALRRKFLISGPAFGDQEVISGVEDMQVQFGIDLGRDANNDGVVDDIDGNGPDSYTGVASQFVNPNAVPATALVVAVRFWLLVRSETAEQGFTDNNSYVYADRLVANGTTNNLNAANSTRAYRPGDNFRRLLVMRTVQLRNTLGIAP
ncbi:MAG TPA: PilW family protein [Steroidobacteraceae bacterium]|nr:PilW family protein [Steroidobacteraceae bacterium]